MFLLYTAFFYLCSLAVTAPLSFAEATAAEQALIQEYETASRSGDPDRIKAAWDQIIQDQGGQFGAKKLMDENASPDAADHFRQRTGIENLNAAHREQAERGEIVPFEEIEGDKFNERVEAAKDPKARKKVTGDGDRFLADLAEPDTPHTDGRAAEKDEGLAELVKESEEKRVAREESQRAVTQQKEEGGGGADNRLSGEESQQRAGESGEKTGQAKEKPSKPSDGDSKFQPDSAVPESKHVKVLDDVSTDAITPEDGSQKLKQLDSTPEAALRESRGYSEAGPKSISTEPPAIPKAAADAAGAPPVAAETETHVEFTDGDMSGVSGKAMQTVDTVTDAADWGGWLAEAVHTEEVNAAKGNRDFSKWNASVNAFKGLAAGQSYEIFKKHGEAAKSRTESTGESKFLAGLTAWGSATGEFLNNAVTGVYRLHEQYQKEEMEKEIARAQKAGDAADPWRAKIPALMRVMGDVLPVNKFAQIWADDSLDALRSEAQMRVKVEQRTKAAVEVGLAEFGVLERNLRKALLEADGSISEEVLALQKQYHDRMSALQDLRNELKAKGLINPEDPEWKAINQSVDLLDPVVVETLKKELASELEDKAHVVAVKSAIQSCQLDAVDGELGQIQVAETKAAFTTEVQALRSRIGEVNQLVAQGGQFAAAGQLVEARNAYKQALERSTCASAQSAILASLMGVEEKIIATQKIEAIKRLLAEKDCSGIKDSVPAWDPKTETAVCGCPDGMELNRKGTYCRAPIAEQMRTKKCGPGMIVEYNQAHDVVTCDCPKGYIRDYNAGVSDMDFMPCIKLASTPSGSSYGSSSGYVPVDPGSYLPPVPSYEEEQNQIAMQNQMFAALQNANQRAYGSGAQQGINLNQMYGNMASGGSQWSDPTNTASGSFYRPAGYTTHSSGGTPAAPTTYTPPRTTYTGGPGQGEFSVSPGTKKDWCTTGRDAAGNCNPVQL